MLRRCKTKTTAIIFLKQKKKKERKKPKAQLSLVPCALNRPVVTSRLSALLRADTGGLWIGYRRFAGLVLVSGLVNPCSLIKLCERSVRE